MERKDSFHSCADSISSSSDLSSISSPSYSFHTSLRRADSIGSSSDLSSISSPSYSFHTSLGRPPSPPLCEYEEFCSPAQESNSSGTPNQKFIRSQNPYGSALDVDNPWQELLEVKQLITNKLMLKDVATGQTDKAQSWLRRVDDMVRIANNLRKSRQFSSLFSWWQIKEVHKLKESITTLVSRGKVLLDALSDTFIGHEDTLSQVGHLIGGEGISSNIIGIKGGSGIGKTRILQEFLEKNRSKIDFNAVIWLTISNDIRTFWIQDEVAKQLDLSVMNYIGEERQRMMLYNALSNKKFLLVLDDLRGVLDLEAIGIPRPTTGSMSKIVIASF